MGTILADIVTLVVIAVLSAVATYLLMLWRLGHILGESLREGCDWLITRGSFGDDYRCNYKASKYEQAWRTHQWSKRVTGTVVIFLISIILVMGQFGNLLCVVTLFNAHLWVLALYLAVTFGVTAVTVCFEVFNRGARAYVMQAMLDTGVEDTVLTRPMTGDIEEDVWRISSDLLDDDFDYFGGRYAKMANPDALCMVITLAGRQYVQHESLKPND